MKAPGQTKIASIMRTLPDRFWIRLHMSLILLGVTLSGIASGKILQLVGVGIVYRYAITVIVSYGVFLVLIRLWLWLVTPRITVRRTEASSQSSQSSSGSVDLPDGVVLPDGILEEGEGASFSGAGGEFGGGGASASFGESASSSSGSSSSSGGGFDIGDVDDARALILLAAIAIVAALLAGVWVYIIYQAPVILTEAFLQVLLASGMFKKARSMHAAGWVGSVVGATKFPLLIVLLLSVGLAFVISTFCSEAHTIVQAVRLCIVPEL